MKRNPTWRLKMQFLLLWAGVLGTLLSLQAQTATATLKPNRIKIGQACQYTLEAKVQPNARVSFPQPKSMGALEVLGSQPVDTVKSEGQWQLRKTYTLTQFDPGTYNVPAHKLMVNGKPVSTQALRVEVRDVPVDTLKQKMFDIKTIIPTESDWRLWPWLLGILLLGGAVAGYVWWQRRQPQAEPEPEVIFATPIEKATAHLQALERKGWVQAGQVKDYYSELTDIARTYIEEEIHLPAREYTTAELMLRLRDTVKSQSFKLSAETLDHLEQVLMQADLVKFAKSTPDATEIARDKNFMANAIIKLHEALPEEAPQDDALEAFQQAQQQAMAAERARQRKRQKQRRALTAVAVALVSLLVGSIALFGVDTVKDTVLGNATKDLLEGPWVLSEYGNPIIRIETPGALLRVDAKKYLPKGTDALYKDMQWFVLDEESNEGYQVFLSTFTYRQNTDIDLDKAVESGIKNLELRGYRNILFKAEQFDTQKGISGKKAYGTMTMGDGNTSDTYFYTLLLFKQQGGLQQILLVHPQNDRFAEAVSRRIMNSVELETPER